MRSPRPHPGEQVVSDTTAGPDTSVYERTGHSAVFLAHKHANSAALFGGKDAAGNLLNNLQFTYREDNTDSTHLWRLYDPIASGTPPSRRWRHASARVLSNVMLVLGGQDTSGNALGDAFRLFFDGANWQWIQLNPGGTIPAARYGHVAVYDRGPAGSPVDSARVLLFGGRDNSGLLDNSVFALRLTSSPSWYKALAANSDTTQAPSAREGSGAIFDPKVRGTNRQMVLFGGRDADGALLNDAWALQCDAASFSYSWVKLSPATRPAVRMDHAVAYDNQRDLMVVIGGDGNGATGGGQLDDAWGLSLAGSAAWRGLPAMGSLGKRSGHAVAYTDIPPVNNRVMERFVPTAAAGQQWKVLHWAKKLMPITYPFMFVLPSGHVAWAGANGAWTCPGCSTTDNRTMLLDPDSLATNRGWQSTPTWSNKGHWGGAAAAFHAGSDSIKILKCGGHHEIDDDDTTATYVIAFSANGGSGGWRRVATSTGVLAKRRDPNLVILPTGELLVTGGAGAGVKGKAQIWSPSSAQWSAELAEEPKVRNYHSTAVLLPDGRVLCAGGSDLSAVDDTASHWGTVYEPPYLFDSNGNYAARPVIGGNPARVGYGATFTVCCDSAQTIDRVCLIRPGATTHAFDQNQRYVPLTYVKATNPARLLVTAPDNANIAPPGDYFLFLCDSTGGRSIPSVARWIALGSPAGGDTCDTVAPAAVADLSGCYHYPFHNPPIGNEKKIDLAWTSPADDGSLGASGRGRVYDIRYSYQPINTETQFNNATPVGGTPPAPATVGTQQTHRFGDFNPNTVVYFRMKTIDDRGQYVNASAMSNQAVVYTSSDCSEGEGLYGGSGGGGGGGSRARRVAGETSAHLQSLEAFSFLENSLLNGSRIGERTTDIYRLAVPPRIESSAYAVRIRSAGALAAALDAARLFVVDHPPDVRAYSTAQGVLVGSRTPAARVTTADGREMSDALETGEELAFGAGEILTVDLLPADSPVTAPHSFILEAGTLGGGTTTDDQGIVVQIPDGNGGWQSLRKVYPRQNFDEIVVDSIGVETVRLVLERNCFLRFVGRLGGVAPPSQVQLAELVTGRSSHSNDAVGTLAASDSATFSLVGPDTLLLGFSVPPQADSTVRSYFLLLEAMRLTPRSGPTAAAAVARALPVRFALHQNQPNPFRARTTIRFDLPVGAVVRLELFDLRGRQVRVLTDRYFPAGNHSVEWDKGTASEGHLGPGIYFYRIQAGPFRDRKKLVLLP